MRSAFRYGLVAFLLICIPMFGPWLLFGTPSPEWMKISELVGYTSMALCLTATYFAMRAEQARRGPLGYGQALGIGVAVSAVTGMLFGAATWGFFIHGGDALPEALITYYRQQIEASGAPDMQARLAELEAMRPLFFNRPLQSGVMAATVFLIGVAESLIGAWWVRRGPAAARTRDVAAGSTP